MPECFVIMGFGEKTDPETGRKLNLDATYHHIIKPAVLDSGYGCVRADEIYHSGVIDRPMYDRLFNADLVVADVSTSNLNAIFELGVRHALRPRSTIVIAEHEFKSPFDINHVVIRKYTHLGTDIGFGEVGRMQGEIKKAIAAIQANDDPDSPVYTFLKLQPPVQIGAAARPLDMPDGGGDRGDTYAKIWQKVEAARIAGDFAAERAILLNVYNQLPLDPDKGARPVRPRVVRELAFVTYKLGEQQLPGDREAAARAYAEAIDLLRILEPERTTDPETLGLWSAVHKRRFFLPERHDEQKRADLDTAIYAAERGFLIRQDHYNGANLAFLFDLRASINEGDEKIADRVFAGRTRRRVVAAARQEADLIVQRLAKDGWLSATATEQLYWAKATYAEALLGLDDPAGQAALKEAIALDGVSQWMINTTMDQVSALKQLRSP